MGARGPLPIPHARRRNKRPAGDKRIEVGHPSKPAFLKGEAAAEWKRIVPELETMGVLATIDRAVLVRYCQAWADWCELNEHLQATGKLVKGRRDALVRNPLWIMRSDIETTLGELGRQLTLSPAARLRVGVVHEQPDPVEQAAPTAIAEYKKALGL